MDSSIPTTTATTGYPARATQNYYYTQNAVADSNGHLVITITADPNTPGAAVVALDVIDLTSH